MLSTSASCRTKKSVLITCNKQALKQLGQNTSDFSIPIPGSAIVRVVSFNGLIRGLELRANSRKRVAHLGSRSKIAVLCHALYDDRQSIYRQRIIIDTQIDSRCYDTPLAVL